MAFPILCNACYLVSRGQARYFLQGGPNVSGEELFPTAGGSHFRERLAVCFRMISASFSAMVSAGSPRSVASWWNWRRAFRNSKPALQKDLTVLDLRVVGGRLTIMPNQTADGHSRQVVADF